MKKSFFLYFLVLSPLLFSQNSYLSNLNDLMNYPVLNSNTYFTFSDNDLTIIDKNYSVPNIDSWHKEPTNYLKEENDGDFSSLLLIKQLKELDQLTPFQIQHNPTLERYIRVFLKDRRESLSKLMDRASYYFPIFEEHLDKYNLPLEIKYLAIVESALKPDAVSSSGAKGLWQFMYATGKQFNLQVDSYVDDRFDPIKSTEAACKYLSSLYKMFNDWDLALAAYNSGPGNVRKAIKRSGGKRNYWEIRQFLPKETHGYLPAFYATYYIFEYADTHGLIAERSSLTYFEIDTIHVKKEVSFNVIQHNVPIKKDLLKALNPQYKRNIIPYSKTNKYVLTLPKTLILNFIENEHLIYHSPIKKTKPSNSSFRIKVTEFNSYVVQKDDNLNKIARKHQISLSQLKKWNGLQTDYLIADQRLVITNKSENTSFSPTISPDLQVVPHNKTAVQTIKYKSYTVKEGDTLFNISKKFYNITINQIIKWNNLSGVKYLKPGTKLKIYSTL
jgi:peptidoglycan lytic transglycosylase D